MQNKNSTKNSWKQKVKSLKTQIHALYLAQKHPKTPWYAKLFTILLFLLVFSPIDLIPDFIPILGILDDLILVPLGIFIALQLIPTEIMEECHQKAQTSSFDAKPSSWIGASLILLLWCLILYTLLRKLNLNFQWF